MSAPVTDWCGGWPTDPGTTCTAWGREARMHGCGKPVHHTGDCECPCDATHHNPHIHSRRKRTP